MWTVCVKPMLISDDYRKLNSDLHGSDPNFGTSAGAVHAVSVADAVNQTKCKTLLDYGCGKGTLKPALQPLCPALDIREYDPARPDRSAPPEPADFVVCFDVMERIEPELLENVLTHLRSVTKRFAFLVISLKEADKVLTDGRNAHLIIKPREWWLETLSRHFDVLQERPIAKGGEMMAFVRPKAP